MKNIARGTMDPGTQEFLKPGLCIFQALQIYSVASQRVQKTQERDFPNGVGGHWKTYRMFEALPLQGVEIMKGRSNTFMKFSNYK